MGADVTEDCRDITIHEVSFNHRKGPVFYASLPCSTESFDGHRVNGSGDRRRLVSSLLDHLAATKSPDWKNLHSSAGDNLPVRLASGPLGRPRLLLGEHRGPAVSFSEGEGKVWAALCGDRSDIGIDAAGVDEFQKEYPFHRVFNEKELHHALRSAGGELGSASALLWSIKEAVVKAMGCAFHLVNPRQVIVYPSIGGSGEYVFPVCLSRKASMPSPLGAGRFIWVCSLPRAKTWLSIALLSRQSMGDARGDGDTSSLRRQVVDS